MKRSWFAAIVLVAVAFLLKVDFTLAQEATGDGLTTPLDSLSTFALWSIVGGAVSSVATSVINQKHWQSTTKLVVFFVACVLVAAGNAYFNRSLDLANWSRSLVLVVASGWTTYYASKGAIKEIEAKTTLQP